MPPKKLSKRLYTVVVREIYTIMVDVEATSESEALDAAGDAIEAGNHGESEYSWTWPKDKWDVTER